MAAREVHIGIIGFGPKGLYGLERLLASLHAHQEVPRVHVHLYNKTGAFATGWVYAINQPRYLLMNYPNGFISLAPVDAPPAICNIMSFTQWQAIASHESIAHEQHQVAPRREVGKYLSYYFDKLCETVHKNITVHRHIATVIGIEQDDCGYLVKSTSGSSSARFSSLLITTGHSPSIESRSQHKTDDRFTIPFVYPVMKKLGDIKPQAVVVCMGMGLTAIDTILALTEGRGGKFIRKARGWRYVKSGEEPRCILPYSRSGLPIIPRGVNGFKQEQTSFYLRQYVSSLSAKATQLDFIEDVLPLIKQDILAHYYHSLFKIHGFKTSPPGDFKTLQQDIKSFHATHESIARFDVGEFLAGNLGHEDIREYWQFWIDENQDATSPFLAAAAAWRFLADDFNYLYSNDLLTPSSKIEFQKSYFGLFNRIAYGPPVVNIQKMLALMDSGILDCSMAAHPEIKIEGNARRLVLKDKQVSIDHSIDARLPRGFSKGASVIFTQDDSLFSMYDCKGDITELNCSIHGHPINPQGEEIKSITLYGTPTEGKLFDNDSLSRKQNDTATQWAHNTVAQIIKNENCTPV